jgi:hypothetical protein
MLVKLRIYHQSFLTRQYALIIRIIQTISNCLNALLYVNLHAVFGRTDGMSAHGGSVVRENMKMVYNKVDHFRNSRCEAHD